jgi:hypothetical protein
MARRPKRSLDSGSQPRLSSSCFMLSRLNSYAHHSGPLPSLERQKGPTIVQKRPTIVQKRPAVAGARVHHVGRRVHQRLHAVHVVVLHDGPQLRGKV